MLKKGKPTPNVLPGADPQTDCQTPDGEIDEPSAVLEVDPGGAHDDHEHDVTWRDVGDAGGESVQTIAGWIPQRAGWTIFLERVALAVERPANRLIGTAQLNPFYHTGTIATLLLIIVALTGFFLFLFFQYGFDASYNAVMIRIETPFIARTVRAVHRYASGALVITTLLHAFRTLFMERFRGPRWLAWVTGIFMTGLLWFAGVTGYWLIWDERAQLINDAFVGFLQTLTPFAAPYMVMITEAAASGDSWAIFLAIFAVHVLLFLIVAVFYWYHIKRLSRPKWLPPAFWVVGVAVVVLLVSLFFPAGMLPQGDLTRLPGPVTIDPLFLFYLPASEDPVLNGMLWGSLIILAVVLTALPWIRGRRREHADAPGQSEPAGQPVVNIIKDRCTGCTVCAVDCPYKAIEMVDRTDGKRHKYIAIEDAGLCVSCGICVGSCDGVAVTLGQTPPVALWDTVSAQLALVKLRSPIEQVQVVFTCERHAVQGGRPYIEHAVPSQNGMAVEVVTLPCVGTAPPGLLSRTLDEGVANVHIIGCPPDDCANREGNLWLEQRLTRERVPRLKRSYANAPITASWLPPDDFGHGIAAIPTAAISKNGEDSAPDYMSLRRMARSLTWRNYAVAFLLLAIVMVVQIFLTDLPYVPYVDKSAVSRVVISDVAAPIGRSSYISTILGPDLSLRLEIDGQVVLEEPLDYAAILESDAYPFYEQLDISPGEQRMRLSLNDPSTAISFTYFDGPVSVTEGDIITIPPPAK